jgi:hypothetical protein
VTSALIPPFFLTLAVSFLTGIGLREHYEDKKKFQEGRCGTLRLEGRA